MFQAENHDMNLNGDYGNRHAILLLFELINTGLIDCKQKMVI